MIETLRQRATLVPRQSGARIAYTGVSAGVRARGDLDPPTKLEPLIEAYGKSAWIYAAVWQRAIDQAMIPLHVMRREEGGWTRVPDEHPLVRLLDEVNPYYTFFDLILLNSLHLDLTGNDYWLVFPDRRGRPMELWPVPPTWVRVLPDPERYVRGYLISPPGLERQAFEFPPLSRDSGGLGVIHFRRPDPVHPYYGTGPMRAAWVAAATEQAASEYRHAFYRNSARPDLVLRTEQMLSESAVQSLRERWAEIFQGPSRAYRVAVLAGGLELQPVPFPPIDQGIVQDRRAVREDLIVAFQVSLAVLGIETGDVGRREEQIRFYYERSIKPSIAMRIATLQDRLLPLYDEPLTLEPDWSGVSALQEDAERKARAEQLWLATGGTINELRARRGLPKCDDPIADVPLVSATLVPITQLGVQAFGAGLTATPVVRRSADPDRETARATEWRALDRVAMRLVSGYRPGVLAALARARTAMREALEQDLRPASALTSALAILREELVAHGRRRLPDVLRAGWERGRRLLARGRERRAAPRVEMVPDFDLSHPAIRWFLEQRPQRYALLVSATLADLFRPVLAELEAQGASVADMTQTLEERWEALTPTVAERIVRTEVISAANAATYATFQEAQVEQKEWLSARDSRVRDTHRAADGQIVAMAEPFTVGAARLAFPGDPDGPPEEIINCRCVVIPVITA